MLRILLSVIFFSSFSFLVAQPLFDASIHTAVPFGNVNSPATETAQQAIDQDPMTKFLDFNIADGFGFDVDLLGVASAASSIRLVTANDAPQRDPVALDVFGSNNGTDYELVYTDTLDCVSDRFLARTLQFDNTTAYSFYRINFTIPCAPSAIMQIADVQLFAPVGMVPTLDCPTEDIVVSESPGECGGVVDFEVTATDFEDGALATTLTAGLPTGSTYPVGSSVVTFEAVDSDNNLVSCSFNVVVTDNELPSFVCPEDTTIVAGPDDTAIFAFNIGVTDNCGLADTISNYIPLANIDGQAYYLSTFGVFALDAIVEAENQGGFPGTIRSEDDNDLLFNAMRARIVGFIDVLIGYTDFTVEGEFGWISGDLSTYTNWNDGEPNNSGPNMSEEDFVTMLDQGRWNDVNGEEQLRLYLLEKAYELEQTAGPLSGTTLDAGTTTNYAFRTFDLSGNEADCSFNVTVDFFSSVREGMLPSEITIAPNPTANGQVVVNFHSSGTFNRVSIYNHHGQLRDQIPMSLDNSTVDVSNLPKGLYFLRFTGGDGEVTKKLIVQ